MKKGRLAKLRTYPMAMTAEVLVAAEDLGLETLDEGLGVAVFEHPSEYPNSLRVVDLAVVVEETDLVVVTEQLVERGVRHTQGMSPGISDLLLECCRCLHRLPPLVGIVQNYPEQNILSQIPTSVKTKDEKIEKSPLIKVNYLLPLTKNFKPTALYFMR